MPPSRSQASSSSTPRSARLVGPYSFPNRLPALPDLSLTKAWYNNLPELDDYVQPDPPKPKFMTVEAMAAIVREKARQAEKAKQEYQKKALAAEKARQESEAKRMEYENAKANLQWVRLMSPLDYAEMMTAMQQMRQAEGRWMDSLPRQESHWPRVSSEEEDDLEMVRYIRMRWVRVEDEGVSLDDGGWTQVEEEVETTKAEMIRYFKANYQQPL